VRQGTVEARKPLEGAPFDLIAANISALVLKNAAAGLAEVTRPNGLAILSGVLEWAAPEVRSVFERHGWEHVQTRAEVEWAAILVRRKAAVGLDG
jgi:ribosomal protein L11 methylase PrmA